MTSISEKAKLRVLNDPKLQKYIKDINLFHKWNKIKSNMTVLASLKEVSQGLIINDEIIIAKNSDKMKLLRYLDWVHYDPKDLANAIMNKTTQEYYDKQLSHSRTDPNIWNDKQREKDMKEYYANRK